MCLWGTKGVGPRPTRTLKKRDYTCSGDPQYWHQGTVYTQDISKTRASYFTCPCK